MIMEQRQSQRRCITLTGRLLIWRELSTEIRGKLNNKKVAGRDNDVLTRFCYLCVDI